MERDSGVHKWCQEENGASYLIIQTTFLFSFTNFSPDSLKDPT